MSITIEKARSKTLGGTPLSIDEAIQLGETVGSDDLCTLADEVRVARCGNKVHTCSIVNARSGRCPEDCHWCAQSARFNTGVKEYPLVDTESVTAVYRQSRDMGVSRMALVTSGRRVTPEQLPAFCDIYNKVSDEGPFGLCASMGLLGLDEMKALRAAGVSRYHCNLETASSLFHTLCTTHTREQKLATIWAAREAGMQVCSGGIIGMGETRRQRLELAEEARMAGADSIPVNLLCPIPGTPLENAPALPEEEIIVSIALMRLIAPDCQIFFAGGRARLSDRAVRRILRGGANGAMVGNMLTTVGPDMEADFKMFNDLGYEV